MSVLANAAGEATRKQILSVLQYDGELSKYNACNKVIKNLLEKKQNIFSKMVVSNALWVNKDKPVYQSFLSVIRNFYDADVFAMLFDSQDAGKAINSWCSDKTNGLINEIVDDGPLPYNLFLANAVYFFSGWSNEFDESLTAKEEGYDSGADSYIKEVNGEEFESTQYVYPQKDSNGNYFITSHTIAFATPVRNTITFTPSGKQVVWTIQLNGTKDVKKKLRGDLNDDGIVNITDVMILVNILLGKDV